LSFDLWLKLEELSRAYDSVKFKDQNEFLLAAEMLGSFDQGQDTEDLLLRAEVFYSAASGVR